MVFGLLDLGACISLSGHSVHLSSVERDKELGSCSRVWYLHMYLQDKSPARVLENREWFRDVNLSFQINPSTIFFHTRNKVSPMDEYSYFMCRVEVLCHKYGYYTI